MSENLDPISIARRLQGLDLFFVTPRLLAGLFSLEIGQGYALVDRLETHGLVRKVEKGKYLLLGLEPERVLSNPFFIATQLATPSYVSFWSALHHYGLAEQVPQAVLVATTQKKRPVAFDGHRFQFVTLKPHKFFGYEREPLGGLPVLMADKAKALLDSLGQPRYAGGIAEVAHSLALALPDLDLRLLIEYANRVQDRSLASRLGFLLECLGASVDGLSTSISPVLLDPTGGVVTTYNGHWRVRVNRTQDELFAQGVG